MGNSSDKKSQKETSSQQMKVFNCCKVTGNKNQDQIQIQVGRDPLKFSQYNSQQSSRINAEAQQPSNSDKILLANINQFNKEADKNGTSEETNDHFVLVKKFNHSKLVEIKKQETYNPIPVRFEVIKLLIPSQIRNQIQMIDSKIFEMLSNPLESSYRGWKLESSGFYSNKCSKDQMTLLVSEDQFFKGKTLVSTFTPHGQGILITKKGYYQGKFSNGQADGKGEYHWNNINKSYYGLWQKGEPSNGEMKTANCIYKGHFLNCLPDGYGETIVISQSFKGQIKYVGHFQGGRFHGHGKLECHSYIYKGNFTHGTKNGIGKYRQKKRNQNSHGKYKAPRQFQGQWKLDVYMGKSKK